MSVLGKLQSNKKSLRNSILFAFACFAVFACQSPDKQSEDAAQVNADTSAAQQKTKVTTPASNDFALPVVQMAPAETVQKTPRKKEEIVETFQLEVIEQTVIVPAKKDASTGSATGKVQETVVEIKVVEQTKQTKEQAVSSKDAVRHVSATPATTQTPRSTRAVQPRNSTRDRVTTPGLLPTPMWIVVIATTTREADAIRLSSQHWSLGYKSNYFWAPDYGNSNEQVFKVFLGPFPNKQLAEQFVNERNDPNFQIIYLQ
ncbi:MAG: hypothetical protein FWC39_08875 [Bacteroidetes bacterium]|nr:hypothetical protein [Bacteroidota bacterium]